MLNRAGNWGPSLLGEVSEMQHLSCAAFQCWVTHPIADLGRKFLLFCNRKIRCCWEDVLGEDQLFG